MSSAFFSKTPGLRNMKASAYRQHIPLLLCFCIAIFAFSACSPRVAERSFEARDLQESSTPADSILSYMHQQQGLETADGLQTLEGRASARVSMPGSSEQASLRFVSDRRQSLLSFRNNLGIEGGRIYANADSVLIYDRIEKTAQKMSIERSRYALLNGFTAFNIITLLFPDIETEPAPAVYENAQRWVLRSADGLEYEISKESGLLTAVHQPAEDPLAYNRFIFSEHAEIQGISLPRRIQILSKDEESSIFLLIQALEINPANPNFDPDIPEDISVERLN